VVLTGLGTVAAQVPGTDTTWRPAPPPTPVTTPQPVTTGAQPTQYVLPAPPGAARPTPPSTPPKPLVPANPTNQVIRPVQGTMPYQPRQSDIETSPISLDIPGWLRIAGHLDTEKALQERIRQEGRERDPNEPERNITFPDEVTLSKDRYPGRSWPRQFTYAEPNYVLYKRLYFEELNSERYGWDLGPLSPVVSGMYFYRDIVIFPYRFGSDFCRCHEANTGYCLPGDPVPYRLYPIGASLSGSAVEAATIVTLLAAFP
jgi:hypothetical protein